MTGSGAYPWHLDAQTESILFLTNMGDRPSRIGFQVHANGVSYYLTKLKLSPHETRVIDLRKLRDAQEPDFQNNRIPAQATDGSVLWARLDQVPIMGRMMVVQRHQGMASSYSCPFGCQCGPVLSFLQVTISPPTVSGYPGDTQQFLCIQEKDDCHGTAFFFDITSQASWLSSDPSVATINSTGFATAVGVGGTDLTGRFTDTEYWWDTFHSNCVETQRTEIATARCNVSSPPPRPPFNVEYSSYIPVDHVFGALYCTYGITDVRLIYMGDANRTTIRTKEFVNIVPDTQRSSGFAQITGQSRNYGFGSPANGPNLSAADEDGVPNDCYLWNNAATASQNFSYDVSFPQAHQGQVHYAGAASNPLETDLATIKWDMRTVIDTPNPQSPTAYVNYNHTCYPAHQIKVNGQVIYLYRPPQDTFLYISECLLLHLNPVIGVTSPVPVPTQ